MKKLIFALFALVLSTEVFAQNTVDDFQIPARGNGGKVIIVPRDAGGTAQTMLTADPVAGTITAAKPFIQVDYVGVNPEVGGSNYLSATTNVNNSPGSNFGFTSSPQTDGSFGTPRTANETRPQNIGVNYCIRY